MPSLKYNNVEIDFGTGSDGALTVASGQTITLTTDKQYTNVTVQSGGVLVIARPQTATFTATTTANSTALTVSGVTGTIAAGNEIIGCHILEGTTIVSGSGTSWTLSQNQTVTLTTNGSASTYGAMPNIRVNGTLTVDSGGIIRGDYYDDNDLNWGSSWGDYLSHSKSNRDPSNGRVYYPGALYGCSGFYRNPDNPFFSWNGNDHAGPTSRGAGGGGGAGAVAGTSGGNGDNDYGSAPGGGGGSLHPTNARPNYPTLSSYLSNLSVLFDGHRGGYGGSPGNGARGRGGRSVKLIARYMVNNGTVSVNGENGTYNGNGDGAGGGAGTFVLFCMEESGSGKYTAQGGTGGTGGWNFGAPNAYGGTGGSGTLLRYVGISRFTGTSSVVATPYYPTYQGVTTGYSQVSALTYVPDIPIVLHDATVQPSGSTTTTSGTYITYSHTCTGSNLLLIVSVTTDGSQGATSVTYNGVAMTLLRSAYSDGVRNELWYLINPSTGANSVVVTTATACYIECASSSFTGVDSAQPFRTYSSQCSTTPRLNNRSAVTKIYSNTNDLIFSVIATNTNTSVTSNGNLGNVGISRWSSGATYRSTGCTHQGISETDASAWTMGASVNWVTSCVSIAVSGWGGAISLSTNLSIGALEDSRRATNAITSTASYFQVTHNNGGPSTTAGTSIAGPYPIYPHNSYVTIKNAVPASYNGFWQINSNLLEAVGYGFRVTSALNPGTASTQGTIFAPDFTNCYPQNAVTSGTYQRFFGNSVTMPANGTIQMAGIVAFTPSSVFDLNGCTISGVGMGLSGSKPSGMNFYGSYWSHGGSTNAWQYYKEIPNSIGNNYSLLYPPAQTRLNNYVIYINHYKYGLPGEGTLWRHIVPHQGWDTSAYNWTATQSGIGGYFVGRDGISHPPYDGAASIGSNGAEYAMGGAGGGNGGQGGDGTLTASYVKVITGGNKSLSGSTVYYPFKIGQSTLTLSSSSPPNYGGKLKHGQQYKILTPNSSPFTSWGASANTAGTIFFANTQAQNQETYEVGGGIVQVWPPYNAWTYQTGSELYDVFIFNAGVTPLTTSTAFKADILIVGGGGSGGATIGGGGGGGAVIQASDVQFNANTTYTLNVGVGGNKVGWGGTTGDNATYRGGKGGQATSLSGGGLLYTAPGGGGGAGYGNATGATTFGTGFDTTTLPSYVATYTTTNNQSLSDGTIIYCGDFVIPANTTLYINGFVQIHCTGNFTLGTNSIINGNGRGTSTIGGGGGGEGYGNTRGAGGGAGGSFAGRGAEGQYGGGGGVYGNRGTAAAAYGSSTDFTSGSGGGSGGGGGAHTPGSGGAGILINAKNGTATLSSGSSITCNGTNGSSLSYTSGSYGSGGDGGGSGGKVIIQSTTLNGSGATISCNGGNGGTGASNTYSGGNGGGGGGGWITLYRTAGTAPATSANAGNAGNTSAIAGTITNVTNDSGPYDITGTNGFGGGPGGGGSAYQGAGQTAGAGYYSGGGTTVNTNYASGGGGAGGPGTIGQSGLAGSGNGGAGILSSITGTPIYYGAGGGGGVRDGYAHSQLGGGLTLSAGGTGGKGGWHAQAGVWQTGSGGGGAGFNSGTNDYWSGQGADGVIILRIKRSQFNSTTIVNRGGYVTMGSGGSSGGANGAFGGNTYEAADGGNGGAAILIGAITVKGAGTINMDAEIGHLGYSYFVCYNAYGGSAPNTYGMPGGAGGAGGTVLIRAKYYFSNATIYARGGNAANYGGASQSCMSGGGGGGIVLIGAEQYGPGASTISSSTVAAGANGTGALPNGGTDYNWWYSPTAGLYAREIVSYDAGQSGNIIWY